MAGDGLPVIETERLILRPYALADARRVQEICGDWEVARTTLNLPHPYPDGAAVQWIATHEGAFREGTGLTLAITLKPRGTVAGSVSLSIEARHSRGELGYVIAREYWNRGYCTEAVRAVIEYGFREMNLNRIQARHFPWNPASGRVMQKAGLTQEGVLRGYVCNRGGFEDLALYSVLRSESEPSPRSGHGTPG